MRPQSPSDPPRTIVQLPSGPVSLTDVGSGPVLIACHGCPGSVRDWRWMGPALEPHLRFIRLDLPGFGETPLATWPDPTLSGRAQFVLAVADTLGIQRFGVVAHSAGGPMSLELAARHGDRVTALAMLGCPGLRPHRPLRENPNGHRIARLLGVPGFKRPLTAILRRGFAKAGFPGDLPGDAYRQSMHIVNHFDFDRQGENARSVAVPTLLAWTADDPFIEAEVCDEMAQVLPPGARLRFDDGGHYLQKTRATECSQAIVTLLEAA
jgi:pimeloyl-ACP methyl ester carboxylesterase